MPMKDVRTDTRDRGRSLAHSRDIKKWQHLCASGERKKKRKKALSFFHTIAEEEWKTKTGEKCYSKAIVIIFSNPHKMYQHGKILLKCQHIKNTMFLLDIFQTWSIRFLKSVKVRFLPRSNKKICPSQKKRCVIIVVYHTITIDRAILNKQKHFTNAAAVI